MNTITLKDSSLNSIQREIGNLSRSFNSTTNKIDAISASILAGYQQAPQFDGKLGGNAYCQKIPALINTVNKFSPARAKLIIQFFAGKVPFSLIQRDGEFRLSKLNWDALKDPEVLQAEAQVKADTRKAQADTRKAQRDEIVRKAGQAESLAEQLKIAKAELAKAKAELVKVQRELDGYRIEQALAA